MNWRCRCKRCNHLFLGPLSDTPHCTGCTAEIEREKGDAAELKWFRRREKWIRRMVDAEGWAEMDAKRCSVWDFERKDPKPGAGT